MLLYFIVVVAIALDATVAAVVFALLGNIMFVNITNKHNISLQLYRARNTHIVAITKIDSLHLNVDVILLFVHSRSTPASWEITQNALNRTKTRLDSDTSM